MDFFNDLKLIVQNDLATLNVTIPPAATVEELLLLVLNHELKTVRTAPRTVRKSKEFDNKLRLLDLSKQRAAADIIQKIENGEDINPHLSKSSVKPKETDGLRADWNIYHLHISNHKKNVSDKFYAHTGPVMFVQIAATEVYFIDIYSHGSGFPETWTRQELLKIVNENWPHLLDPFRLKSVSAVAHAPTDLELKQLRGGNVSTIIQVGSSFIAPPGGGLATDGTPIINVERAHRTLHLIKNLEKWVLDNIKQIKSGIAAKSNISESTLDFELVAFIDPAAWAVREKKTGIIVIEQRK